MPGSTIVVKLSGSLLDAAATRTLVHALDELEASNPHARVVLVHGGGPQLDAALARLDEPVERYAGLRITSRGQAGVVHATLDGLGEALTESLTDAGHPAVHVSGIEQRLVARVKRLPDGPDLGRVGTPVAFDPGATFERDAIPVVTPVGTDGAGPLNVNADEGAATVAAAVDADHLVLATRVPGVLDEHGNLIETLTPTQAAALVDAGTADGGMQPKLGAAVTALEAGVARVHVTDLSPTTLVDLVEASAPGTCITSATEVPA